MKLLWLIGVVLYQILNYSMTEFALKNVFAPEIHYWATFLTICFCMIDFTPISIIFKNKETDEDNVGYFLGAWILVSAMNAIFHWWGFVVAFEPLDGAIGVLVAVILFVIRLIVISGFVSAWNKADGEI